MKYTRFIIIGLALIFLIYVFFAIYQSRTKNNEQNTPLPYAGQPSKQEWETKTDDQPPVNIKITPVELGMSKGVHEGILVFGPINPFPQSVELKIRDVGGIPERSFKWDIQ